MFILITWTSISLQVLHEKVHDQVVAGLVKAYKQLRVGDPLDGKLLDSPLLHWLYNFYQIVASYY